MLIEHDDTSPLHSLRDKLKTLDHYERTRFIKEELIKLYDKQTALTDLVSSGVDVIGVLVTQKILSEHCKMLQAMAAENFRGMDYLLPKPIAIAIDSEAIEEKDISLIAGKTKVNMSDILAGMEKTDEL